MPVVVVHLGNRSAVVDRQRASRAGEDKLSQVGLHSYVEYATQAVDVGVKQRAGVTQPHSRVDDAVVDDIAFRHRPFQRGTIEDVTVKAFHVKAFDAVRRAGSA